MSLRRCIATVENIDENASTKLFMAPSSQTPIMDDTRVSILAYPGPGCTPNEPIALAVKAKLPRETARDPFGGFGMQYCR
jgi:hypothetical protein